MKALKADPLYMAAAFIAFTFFICDSFKGDNLLGAGVLLVVCNATQPHEDTVLCEELAECCSRYPFHCGSFEQLFDRSVLRPIGVSGYESDHPRHAVGDLTLFKLLLARALDGVPVAISECQLQLPELDIALRDREGCASNATRR